MLYIIYKKILKEKMKTTNEARHWTLCCAEIKKQQQQLKILTLQLKNVEFKEG